MRLNKLYITLIIFILMINTYAFAKDISSEGVLLVNTTIKSRDYDKSFWVYNLDGDALNIYIKNNGKNPIEHKITHGKSTVRSKGTIYPGDSELLTLTDDRTGKWTVSVYTLDGSNMNTIVQSRQF